MNVSTREGEWSVVTRLKEGRLRPLLLTLYPAKQRLSAAALRLKFHAAWKKYRPFTMIRKEQFLDNLALVARAVDVPGCVVECGVWRGGMMAAMADVLGSQRHYYLFDSFEGLPKAEAIDGPAALRWQSDTTSPMYFDNCAAEMEFAQRAMAMSPARKVTFEKGWFNQTLPGFRPDQGIAVLRLDGDWYESTMQCLEALYQYVVPGGLIIIDDYYVWDGCAKAVHDYLSANKLADRICQTPNRVCYLVRQPISAA